MGSPYDSPRFWQPPERLALLSKEQLSQILQVSTASLQKAREPSYHPYKADYLKLSTETMRPIDDKNPHIQECSSEVAYPADVEDGSQVAPVTVLSEYGIHRGLQSHQIQLLAISGAIETGLFVGTASVLASAGPGGLLLGYSIWCVFLLCVAHAMGEVLAYLPVPGSFATHIARFVDESARVAMGWI